MRYILLSSLLIVLLASVSHAQSDDRLRAPRVKADVQKPRPQRPPVNPCAEYGPGFGPIDGTNTCIKIGGSLSVGTSFGSGR